MGISIFKLKKWANMLAGKSIYHVNQGKGKAYSIDKLAGYYNDLSEKVTRGKKLRCGEVPMTIVDTGEQIYFPIAVFQYGLGAYDLYLLNKDEKMLDKIIACSNWAVDNQEQNGAWNTFSYDNKEHPYSSMAQGEGISLLLRAYKTTGNERYLQSAKNAMDFMLIPISDGGTIIYDEDDIYLYECTYYPPILNGWIFSIWGLLDYLKVVDDGMVRNVYNKTINTLVKALPEFDLGYWSKYDIGKRIASPFYHKLHIAQLMVMYDISGIKVFEDYAIRWQKYYNSPLKRSYAFTKKAIQKIFE